SCTVRLGSKSAEKLKQPFNRRISSCFITFFHLAWKSCMDPSLNTLLMDCRISPNLLHIQGIQRKPKKTCWSSDLSTMTQ
ncbi:hypothetical protein Nmel_001828, partial [Mimus melanotis]